MAKRDIFGWWRKKERTFTVEEVEVLVNRIREFNCGAIDAYLDKHMDKTLAAWLKELREND